MRSFLLTSYIKRDVVAFTSGLTRVIDLDNSFVIDL